MRRSVDAARHAADNGQPCVRQIGRQPLARGRSIGRRPARPHHAQHDGLEQFHASAGKQQDGRIVDFLEARRVARI